MHRHGPCISAAFSATPLVCINTEGTITYTGGAAAGAVYDWNFGGGTTYGSTYITDETYAEVVGNPGLLKHEALHATQQALMGFGNFAVDYVKSEAAVTMLGLVTPASDDWGSSCNVYELLADEVAGRYSQCTTGL